MPVIRHFRDQIAQHYYIQLGSPLDTSFRNYIKISNDFFFKKCQDDFLHYFKNHAATPHNYAAGLAEHIFKPWFYKLKSQYDAFVKGHINLSDRERFVNFHYQKLLHALDHHPNIQISEIRQIYVTFVLPLIRMFRDAIANYYYNQLYDPLDTHFNLRMKKENEKYFNQCMEWFDQFVGPPISGGVLHKSEINQRMRAYAETVKNQRYLVLCQTYAREFEMFISNESAIDLR